MSEHSRRYLAIIRPEIIATNAYANCVNPHILLKMTSKMYTLLGLYACKLTFATLCANWTRYGSYLNFNLQNNPLHCSLLRLSGKLKLDWSWTNHSCAAYISVTRKPGRIPIRTAVCVFGAAYAGCPEHNLFVLIHVLVFALPTMFCHTHLDLRPSATDGTLAIHLRCQIAASLLLIRTETRQLILLRST